MAGIEWKAVIADRRAIAFVHEAAQTIMARFAKRPDRAGQEQIVIAAMRREVIADGRGRDAPLRLAQAAERLDLQLVLGTCSPALEAIPGTPR